MVRDTWRDSERGACEGTVHEGTVSEGTVCEGTVSEGMVLMETASEVCEGTSEGSEEMLCEGMVSSGGSK